MPPIRSKKLTGVGSLIERHATPRGVELELQLKGEAVKLLALVKLAIEPNRASETYDELRLRKSSL